MRTIAQRWQEGGGGYIKKRSKGFKRVQKGSFFGGGCIYPQGPVPSSQANKDGPFVSLDPSQTRPKAVPDPSQADRGGFEG